jgi:hypothetical protein
VAGVAARSFVAVGAGVAAHVAHEEVAGGQVLVHVGAQVGGGLLLVAAHGFADVQTAQAQHNGVAAGSPQRQLHLQEGSKLGFQPLPETHRRRLATEPAVHDANGRLPSPAVHDFFHGQRVVGQGQGLIAQVEVIGLGAGSEAGQSQQHHQ